MSEELNGSPENSVPDSEVSQKPKRNYFRKENTSTKTGCLTGCLSAVGAVTLLFFLLIIILILGAIFGGKETKIVSKNTIAVIHIEGEIGSDTGVRAEEIVRLLNQAEEDKSVKSVVLRIDSPGGYAAASQEIADAVKRFKKPVVASVGNSAASGAYWIASACDLIVCNPSSSLGSIGVIITVPTFGELLKKLGIKYVVIYKGKYKDLGNPARDLTPEEKKLLEKHADQIYSQFIEAVALNRKLDVEKVKNLATGEVFTGVDAVNLGLADKLGGFNEAVSEAKRLAKIKGKPEVTDYDFVLPGVFKYLERFVGSGGARNLLLQKYQVPVAK